MLQSDPWFVFIVVCLAVFGVSYSVSQTTGPFAAFKLFREFVTEQWPEDWVRVGVSCPICVSFWVSLPASLALSASGTQFVVFWMALVGFVTLVMVLSPPEG